MAKNTGKTKLRFLKDYELSEAYLRRPGADGAPALIEGFHAGNNVLVKQWPKVSKKADEDLEEIWKHEVRQLHRLAGYPDVGDLIASLYDSGEDSEGFYLVLEPQNRRPLDAVMSSAPPGHWLKNPRNGGSRLRIWRNLERIALGLEVLHSQGILHRNFNPWSILTRGDDNLDFQLTGFEWSMRLSSIEAADPIKRTRKARPANFDSFLSDWSDFGLLSGLLVGARLERLADAKIPASEVADHLDSNEVRFLRQLIGVEAVERIDGEFAHLRISEIARRLESELSDRDAQYRLVVNVGVSSKLSQDVRLASNGEIETSDVEAQLRFIQDDLSREALLVAVREGDDFRFALRGHSLTYRVEAYRPFDQAPSWDFAQCFAADSRPPIPKHVVGDPLSLVPSSLRVMSSSEAREVFGRVRKRVAGWQTLRDKFRDEQQVGSKERDWKRALALTQLLEMAFTASDIFPVRILSRSSQTASDTLCGIQVEIRPEGDRDQLAQVLKLKSQVDRFEDLLNSEPPDIDGGWTLSEAAALGDRNPSDSSWRFVEVVKEDGRSLFRFEGSSPAVVKSEAYFYPSGSGGSIAQFKRRLRALTALGDHQELLGMIADPRGKVLESRDNTIIDDSYLQALDEAKREALVEAWHTMPLYLVQGPPGVGKTHLVRELVRRRFQSEAASRLLLTAQSHAAIDHLMIEVNRLEGFESSSPTRPLIVRCRKKDSSGSAGPLDVSKQAEQLLKGLVKSPLFADGSSAVKAQLKESLSDNRQKGVSSRPTRGSSAGRIGAFESIVLRAANIVFATTNAPELERLIEERGQFDWTVVEEAGKATGSELVSPLLLSHRRLMIGDHKQLPPYRSEEMRRVLDSAEAIDQIIKVAPSLIGRVLRGGGIEELLDEWKLEDLAGIGGAAIDALLMFETMIEREFKRKERGGTGRSIAGSLTVQHRMHPVIADLVSKVFYRGDLTTESGRAKRFEVEPAPFKMAADSPVSNSPITLVSMPDLQAQMHKKYADSLPRWWNEDEVSAVVDVLALVRARAGTPKKPTLAVLAPYAEQVRRIGRRIEELKAGRLKHLAEFSAANATGTFCSTVDAFQGSEADVVIVSLVRNNQYTKPSPALGFLQSFQRMNVLLSRAKYKLIIVGSLDFLRTVVGAMPEDKQSKLWFLKELVMRLDDGIANGRIEVVAPSALSKGMQS